MITDTGTRLGKVVEELRDLVVRVDHLPMPTMQYHFPLSIGIGQTESGDERR